MGSRVHRVVRSWKGDMGYLVGTNHYLILYWYWSYEVTFRFLSLTGNYTKLLVNNFGKTTSYLPQFLVSPPHRHSICRPSTRCQRKLKALCTVRTCKLCMYVVVGWFLLLVTFCAVDYINISTSLSLKLSVRVGLVDARCGLNDFC